MPFSTAYTTDIGGGKFLLGPELTQSIIDSSKAEVNTNKLP
jgi:hypothetical protein